MCAPFDPMYRLFVSISLASLLACSRSNPAIPASQQHPSEPDAGCVVGPESKPQSAKALEPCPPGAADEDELQRASAHYDSGDYEKALACARLAVLREPSNPSALTEQASAASALGELDEARALFARALAVEPDYLDALLGAASLYLEILAPSRDFDELGLAYATRGAQRARREVDAKLAGRFALLQAKALNDLGRSAEALAPAKEALAAGVDPAASNFEKAFALWSLCRFAEARAGFEAVVSDRDLGAAAHYQLSLLAERRGDMAAARREIAEARKLDPAKYPEEPQISLEDFSKMLALTAAQLPANLAADLRNATLSTEDLPDEEDLVANDPPLSPTILGLYRGPPIGEPCTPEDEKPGPCRSIVLYRRNLQHAVTSQEELREQTRITLVHELGHLRGEDDLELIARGLE